MLSWFYLIVSLSFSICYANIVSVFSRSNFLRSIYRLSSAFFLETYWLIKWFTWATVFCRFSVIIYCPFIFYDWFVIIYSWYSIFFVCPIKVSFIWLWISFKYAIFYFIDWNSFFNWWIVFSRVLFFWNCSLSLLFSYVTVYFNESRFIF